MTELLIIPGLALLGLYSIQSSKRTQTQTQTRMQENFEDLPNTNIPDSNYPNQYPVENALSDTTITSKLSTINAYNGGSVYTDKYFNESRHQQGLPQNKKYNSLTGPQDTDYFTHNNMVPFFGSKSRDMHSSNNTNEGLLDSMVGQGSQVITKREIAPLFDAKTNVSWANNMPDSSDFIRSRITASQSMNNVNPFQEQKVAPGLGLGYTAEGMGGFNSGLFAREQWIDKSVDELRTTNNPKTSGLTQLGFEGPAGAYVKNQGKIGMVEKNREETTFELGMERSIGALSSVKGAGIHGEVIDRFVNRPDTSISYSGIAGITSNGNSGSALMDGEYMPSHKNQLEGFQMGPVSGADRFHMANEGDFGYKSSVAYPNNRSTNQVDDYFGIIGQTIGSIFAPVYDVLKPNRKNNVVGTLRPYQNPKSPVFNSYIHNPHDRTATTQREMNDAGQNLWMVNATQYQNGDGYKVAQQTPIQNQRDITTQRSSYIGGGTSAYTMPRIYDAEYNRVSNGTRENTIIQTGFTPGGNMSLFQGDINSHSNPTRESLVMETRKFNPTPTLIQGPNVQHIGHSNGGNSLYSGMGLERNTSDVMGDLLKKNPYAMSSLSHI